METRPDSAANLAGNLECRKNGVIINNVEIAIEYAGDAMNFKRCLLSWSGALLLAGGCHSAVEEKIDAMKESLRGQLDNTYIVDVHGNKRKLPKKKRPPEV